MGTNRYAYSANDPVNLSDPNGQAWYDSAWDSVFGEGSWDRTFGGGGANANSGSDSGAREYSGETIRVISVRNNGLYHSQYYQDIPVEEFDDFLEDDEFVRDIHKAAELATGFGGITRSGVRILAERAAERSAKRAMQAALANAGHNARIAENFASRYPELIKVTRGSFRQVREHLDRLRDFMKNPTVEPNMVNMPSAAIWTQQVERAQKLERDVLRNLSQALDRIRKTLE